MKPLAQLCRRLHEEYFAKNNKTTPPPEIKILKSAGDTILKIRYKEYYFSNKSPDNLVLLKNGEILKIEKIYIRESLMLDGRIWKKKKSVYDYPCESSLLNMWELEKDPAENIRSFQLDSIDIKMILLPMDINVNGRTHMFAVSLLHH